MWGATVANSVVGGTYREQVNVSSPHEPFWRNGENGTTLMIYLYPLPAADGCHSSLSVFLMPNTTMQVSGPSVDEVLLTSAGRLENLTNRSSAVVQATKLTIAT